MSDLCYLRKRHLYFKILHMGLKIKIYQQHLPKFGHFYSSVSDCNKPTVPTIETIRGWTVGLLQSFTDQ